VFALQLAHNVKSQPYTMHVHPTQKLAHSIYDVELLTRKLWSFRHTNTIIAATTAKAENMASRIGEELGLPYYLHYCKAIRHPGNSQQTIGSITANEVVLRDNSSQLPQGYVQHQIVMIKHLLNIPEDYQGSCFQAKNVIVLREEIFEEDQILAVLEELKKKRVASVVVATPHINRDALTKVEDHADQLVYIHLAGKTDRAPVTNHPKPSLADIDTGYIFEPKKKHHR
jgi:predicted phosphoribosyltransferase